MPTLPRLSRRTLFGAGLGAGALAVGGLAVPTLARAAGPGTIVNWFTGYRITGTWADHMSYSEGGIDYGMDVGTGLRSAVAGRLAINKNYGTGGWAAIVAMDNGWGSYYLHCSGFAAEHGARVNSGDVIARSGGRPGAPGAGSSTGPHLHWHLYDPNGVRRNPLDYAQAPGGAAPSGSAPSTSPGGTIPKSATASDGVPGPIFYQRMQNWLKQSHGYAGPVDGKPGSNTYAALQRALRNHGYTGPIDGRPGVNTYRALQRLAAQHGYTGPIDGQPGPNTYRAVARFLNADTYAKL
ncbi:peptidoglycan DD-metalloendopeptidase family protein [Granulicoccus phenolivorans]|uniref:peptidoglycan DD-metalloendopeptidase family protein n=1 Tax=Granulicoccus phenolivorans TaxID=266854 RepID=UPI000551D641|nr:peptidoglycan DD-metalloendopeptidase family protein [Granulicoccus phenolivorans]